MFHVRTQSKHDLPALLDAFPIIVTVMMEYGRANLADLTIEMMHGYLHETVIKSLVLEEYAEKNNNTKLSDKEYEVEAKKFLASYGLTCVCFTTVYRWMLKIGFKHETRRKGYYVDGHEKKGTIEYRWAFCDRYLALERRMHRWIQVPLKEAKRLKDENQVEEKSGFEYTDSLTGQPMVEFHVDSCRTFMERMNKETRFGGNLSVRMLPCERPVIVMGQDECIVKQYSLTKKAWVGPEGEQPITPKDEGLGIMISAMQSREFGYGMELTQEEFNQVNAVRLGNKYKDEQAAIKKRGKADKHPLTSSPFILEFEYGASAEGYWTYDSMVLQLEDCADVVTTLYPHYQFLFLFDHSCGHDRAREDALNVNNMNTGYGGKQTRMHDTVITHEKGYLGPFARQLQVGDTQSMVWKEGDTGPYWMTEAEREQNRKDIYGTNTRRRNYTKEVLIGKLAEKGIEAKGNLKQIQDMCTAQDILTNYEEGEVKEGWEGKPKGMEQVLWERGWIDITRPRKDYSKLGTKDSMGALQKDTSFLELLANCADFENEETLLQSKGQDMGILVDRTPKCHCELAGEGIEYSWGCAKNLYRRQPLKTKRGKANFRGTVQQCFSREVLTIERVRLFSQRARAYMLAYQMLRQEQEEEGVSSTDTSSCPVNVEKILKKFKSHRCAMDFDKAFCKATFTKSE
jgi:hypothetical protein